MDKDFLRMELRARTLHIPPLLPPFSLQRLMRETPTLGKNHKA